jgi:putative Ca2+/H+ antiporter (TMEM165/GDT1 family)
MDWTPLGLVFGSMLRAEPGDKTQLATRSFAADREVNKWWVFTGVSLALVATSAPAVVAAARITEYVSKRTRCLEAGAGFILVDVWTPGR